MIIWWSLPSLVFHIIISLQSLERTSWCKDPWRGRIKRKLEAKNTKRTKHWWFFDDGGIGCMKKADRKLGEWKTENCGTAAKTCLSKKEVISMESTNVSTCSENCAAHVCAMHKKKGTQSGKGWVAFGVLKFKRKLQSLLYVKTVVHPRSLQSSNAKNTSAYIVFLSLHQCKFSLRCLC